MRSRSPGRTAVLTGSLALLAALVATPSAGSAVPQCDGEDATIVGTDGPDVIVGLGNDDKIDGGAGHDIICGGPGADVLKAAREMTGSSGNGTTRSRVPSTPTTSTAGRETT